MVTRRAWGGGGRRYRARRAVEPVRFGPDRRQRPRRGIDGVQCGMVSLRSGIEGPLQRRPCDAHAVRAGQFRCSHDASGTLRHRITGYQRRWILLRCGDGGGRHHGPCAGGMGSPLPSRFGVSPAALGRAPHRRTRGLGVFRPATSGAGRRRIGRGTGCPLGGCAELRCRTRRNRDLGPGPGRSPPSRRITPARTAEPATRPGWHSGDGRPAGRSGLRDTDRQPACPPEGPTVCDRPE